MVAEALLLWLVAYGLLHLLYGPMDRVLFAAVSDDKRPAFHLAREIATSLSATALTAVYLLWRRVPSLHASLHGAPQLAAAPPDFPAWVSIQRRLVEWFVALRWVAVLAVAAVVVVATTGVRPRVADDAILPMWMGVTALFAFNALMSLLGSEWTVRPRVISLQVLADVVILGWMVHHAGGMANPFAVFFVFQAVIAAIVLDADRARAVVAVEAAFILALTFVEASGLLPPSCMRGLGSECLGQDGLKLLASGSGVLATVVGCAWFVRSLAAALREERDGLATVRGALLDERGKLQSIIDCMADVVIFVDPEGRVLLRNHAAVGAWPVQDNGDLRVCHSPATWERMLDKLANAGPNEIHPVLDLDGRSFEATYARVCDARGVLRGVVMVGRDVTERLQHQAWQMQEERMAVVGKLAAGLAHELNNPLGAIALFTQQAIKRIPPQDALADYLGTVMRNANQCKKIVRDLLEYARQRPPERRDFVVADLLADVYRTLELHAQRGKVELLVERSLDGARMFGDPDQLRQVFVNLGLNAIEAMSEGGKLVVRAEYEDAQHLRFDVCDTGPGVPEAERERIFTAFYTTKEQGTGLGLAVAKDILAAHGGSLSLRREEGYGAVFSIIVPTGLRTPAAEATA